jgi:hypothetical protein
MQVSAIALRIADCAEDRPSDPRPPVDDFPAPRHHSPDRQRTSRRRSHVAAARNERRNDATRRTPRPAVEELTPAPSTRLAALAVQWWAALDAADSALHAAHAIIGGEELADRRRGLANERSKIARILNALARELSTETDLLDPRNTEQSGRGSAQTRTSPGAVGGRDPQPSRRHESDRCDHR